MKRARLLSVALCAAACSAPAALPQPALELFEWERGIGVRALGAEPMAMHLWFYEWNLFDAFEPGDLTAGTYALERHVAPDRSAAEVRRPGLRLLARVEGDSVALELEVENLGTRDWPSAAALIACFNPGPEGARTFEMGHHKKTYMVGPAGLERVADRDMHFNHALRAELEQRSPALEFGFTQRWASSERDSHAGLLLRESLSGGWTSGVAWEDWLGLQAHNPWLCMHAATRVGPLAAGEKRRVRGRLYLFPGEPSEGLRRYRRDFGAR